VGWFIIAIILAVAGIVAVFAAPLNKDYKGVWRITGGALIGVALLLFVISGLKEVPTKSIGVATSFGSVDGQPLGPGIHETWSPWKHVNVLDETIQTTTFEGCQGQFCTGTDPQRGNCLEVRIGGQQTACLDVTIQWRIRDSAADGLFSDYANSGPIMPEITNAVVVRELKQVVNEEMGDYNPIQDVSVNGTSGNSQFSSFGAKVKAQMVSDIGNRIQVVSVLMPLLRYDSTTQSRLNTIQQQYASTAIAQQQIQTNEAQSTANSKLGTPSTAVLEQECLSIVETAVKDGGASQLPAGFSCFGSDASSLALNSGK
jgi:regulator of protease activity HflC (stomatin/prohibitin superfamily)